MFSISIFNNKGGVGKTTLSFHFAHALALLGKKVLIIDLDPQCNVTILALNDEAIFSVWDAENPYIDDFGEFEIVSPEARKELLEKPRSVHFLLKSAEDGQTDFEETPPPIELGHNIFLLPGRLTLHSFEDKLGERWANAYKGDPLAVRTITQIRTIANIYAKKYEIDYIIYDTSPSLGMLNRVILSMADGFIVPCLPDKFSLYGIKNIGTALKKWKTEFETILSLQAKSRKGLFPKSFIKFLGYTIYNAKPYNRNPPLNIWGLAQGHYNFAKEIPVTINDSIPADMRLNIVGENLDEPIGGKSVMHSHNTLPSFSQKYHVPIWELPDHPAASSKDKSTFRINRKAYDESRDHYLEFARDAVKRAESV